LLAISFLFGGTVASTGSGVVVVRAIISVHNVSNQFVANDILAGQFSNANTIDVF